MPRRHCAITNKIARLQILPTLALPKQVQMVNDGLVVLSACFRKPPFSLCIWMNRPYYRRYLFAMTSKNRQIVYVQTRQEDET